MNVHPDVNFEELARSTDDFNGAQLKAVCVEAGMLALRRDATEVLSHTSPVSLSFPRTFFFPYKREPDLSTIISKVVHGASSN
jgi:26S proteasome regulatory subunit T5